MGKKNSQPAPSRNVKIGSRGVSPRPPANIQRPAPPPPKPEKK